MSETVEKTAAEFILPLSVVSKVDVSRLLSEVERIDNELITRGVHQRIGIATAEELRGSQQLIDFLNTNQIKLDDAAYRTRLITQLRELKHSAPVVHLTFATDADQESLQELVQWVRASVHAQAVVTVGLQPGLIGGVYVRTRNHVHDLSVRAQLAGGHDLILEELEALSGRR